MNIPTTTTQAASTFLGAVEEIVDTVSFTQFRSESDSSSAKADTTLPVPVGDNRFDVSRILENPRVVLHGSLPTTNAITVNNKIDFGYDYFGLPAIQNITKNFVGMTFTMCVKVITNADPFSSGLFYLVFVPPDYTKRSGCLISLVTTPVHKIAPAHLLEKAIIDVAECPSATLRIPFYFSTAFYETFTLSKTGVLGEFLLLNSGLGSYFPSAVKPEFTMMAWLEDVEFRYPGDISSQTTPPRKFFDVFPQGPELKSHQQGVSLMVQSSVSEPLDEIQGAPGYVKPFAPVPAQTVPDGAFSGEFTDLFKQESYVGDIHWLDSLAHGEDLGYIGVRPQPIIQNIHQYAGDDSSFVGHHTRTALATHHFNLHNGTLHFRLKLVKTKFHSGRVQVCYTPNAFHDRTKLDWSRHWSTVLDVRDSSEFLISVKGTPTSRAYYRSQTWGYLYFRVINKLNHPDNTTPFVPIMVYVSGDLQVASPRYPAPGDFDVLPDTVADVATKASYFKTKAEQTADAATLKEEDRISDQLARDNAERVVVLNPQGPVLSLAKSSAAVATDIMSITAIADKALDETITYLEDKYPQNRSAMVSVPSKILAVSTESAARGIHKPKLLKLETAIPQMMITDGVILDPGFTTNNAGCNVQKYMQVTSHSVNEFLKTRTIVKSDSNTLSVYLEPVNLSYFDYNVSNKASMGPLNMINSMFLGSRSDISLISRFNSSDFDGLFLVNQYNYGIKDYNSSSLTSPKLFIPWDSNILYAPYRFHGTELGKRIPNCLGSCPNYYAFYPWFPSLTKIIRAF